MHIGKIHSAVFLNEIFSLALYTQIHTSGVVCRIFILFDQYFFTTCHVAYLMKSNPLPSPHTHIIIKSLFLYA